MSKAPEPHHIRTVTPTHIYLKLSLEIQGQKTPAPSDFTPIINSSLRSLYGIVGAASLSYQLEKVDTEPQVAILRVPLPHYRRIWAALTLHPRIGKKQEKVLRNRIIHEALSDMNSIRLTTIAKREDDADHDNQPSNRKRLTLFDSDSDSDLSHPERNPVTRVINSATDTLANLNSTSNSQRENTHPKIINHKLEDAKLEEDQVPASDKESQIARLVKRRKVVEHELGDNLEQHARDEALFRYHLDKCPEQAGVNEYNHTPVNGFGESMLRAMGWKGNLPDGNQMPPKLRPTRLGLGAKLQSDPPPTRKLSRKGNASPEKRLEVVEEKETLKGLASEDEHSGRAHNPREAILEAHRGVSREKKPADARFAQELLHSEHNEIVRQHRKGDRIRGERWNGSEEIGRGRFDGERERAHMVDRRKDRTRDNAVSSRSHDSRLREQERWDRSEHQRPHVSERRTEQSRAERGSKRRQRPSRFSVAKVQSGGSDFRGTGKRNEPSRERMEQRSCQD